VSVAVGALLTVLVPSAGGAGGVPRLRGQVAAQGNTEHAALLQLYAAESSLARARTALAQLEARSQAVATRQAEARRSAALVRRALAASQARVADLLKDLYVHGEPDPIAVVLGAESLDEMMAGIDSLSRATALNQRLARQARARAVSLRVLERRLGERRHALEQARAAARVGTAALESAAARRRSTVALIRRQRALTVGQLARLEQQAQAAQRASLKLAPAAASAVASRTAAAATAGPPPSVGGARTLVVDAVAYHLAGTTASGLPVGVGVIAVDPSVIPLGTRVFVPGYGPAVAADVGSAVKGAIIDLWMPSTSQARAWGRRSVTITIYA
jgi:3D (Asp-Asp-Asp) domain-containing protein